MGARLRIKNSGFLAKVLSDGKLISYGFGQTGMPSGLISMANGSSANQVNVGFIYSGSTNAGATTQLDLTSGLTDPGGAAVVLTKLQFVMIEVTTAGGSVEFGPQNVTNAIQMNFAGVGATDKLTVKSHHIAHDGTGWTVNGTNKILAIKNPGAETVNWILVGAGQT